MQNFLGSLILSDAPAIQTFGHRVLADQITDPMEREMAAWSAPWREESLAHYLRSGWSMGLWSSSGKEELKGYFLAQPLLFYRGLTQSLWGEHIGACTVEARLELEDAAIKYARDKHLQSVFFFEKDNAREVKTTKR